MKEVKTCQTRLDDWKKHMKSEQGEDHDSLDEEDFDPNNKLFDNDTTF